MKSCSEKGFLAYHWTYLPNFIWTQFRYELVFSILYQFYTNVCLMKLSLFQFHLDFVISSNGFHINWIIGTHGNWKNQNDGSCFGATSYTALPIQPIYLKIGPNQQCCLAGSSKTAPRILIFSIAMGADYSFMWNPLLLVHPHFLGILFQS